MEKYESRNFTPLRLHKTYWFAVLPLLMISSIGVFSYSLISGGMNAIALISSAVVFALSLVQFVGFFKWSWYSYLSAMGLFILSEMGLSYFALSSFLRGRYLESLPFALSLLPIVGLLMYYAMRENLFKSDYKENDPVKKMDKAFMEKHVHEIKRRTGDALRAVVMTGKKRCPYCGELIAEDAEFCCYCGNHMTKKEEKSV